MRTFLGTASLALFTLGIVHGQVLSDHELADRCLAENQKVEFERFFLNPEKNTNPAEQFANISPLLNCPSNHPAQESTKAQILMAAGKLNEAENKAQNSIQLDPYDSRSFHLRALIRQKRQNWAGALKDITRAIELDPYNDSHQKLKLNLVANEQKHFGSFDLPSRSPASARQDQ